MSNKYIYIPVDEPLSQQPVVKALHQLDTINCNVTLVECLKKKNGKHATGKSAVYRINCGGETLIAKRTVWSSIENERTIYQDILPELSINSLYCFGAVKEIGSEMGWLFLEEAKGDWFSDENVIHTELATRWLATLHTLTSKKDLAAKLPAHGLDRYATCVIKAESAIKRNLSNPILTGNDIACLQTILKYLDIVKASWNKYSFFYNKMPHCLVHADFTGKNVRVVDDQQTGRLLNVFDWDIAGWGVPTVDLENIEPDFYRTLVCTSWPQLTLTNIEKMKSIGIILRNIGLIQVSANALEYDWVEGPMDKLRDYGYKLIGASKQAETI